jgi:hypothetical protein
MNEKDKGINYIETIKPKIKDVVTENGLTRTYLWKVDEDRNIFLYLNMILKDHQGRSVLFVSSNVDSSDVRGQGGYLWRFMKDELQKYANGELGDIGEIDVISELSPNEYSSKFPEADPDYREKDGSFYAVYRPQ